MGGLKGRLDKGGVYDWFFKKGVNGISLLCKLIFLVLVVLSFIFVGFLWDGDIGVVFFVMMLLYLRMFLLLVVLLIYVCMDMFLGDEIELFLLLLFD